MKLTDQIFMVRPAAFGFNGQTAQNNAFQSEPTANLADIAQLAIIEFDKMVATLREHSITVHVVQDTPQPPKPDAIFPNNWFSSHADGTLVLYPMFAENRRLEITPEALNYFKENFVIRTILDLTQYVHEDKFLEGTGCLIFDRESNIAFVNRSARTNDNLCQQIEHHLNCEVVIFDAFDANNLPVYHTNVIMAMGDDFVIYCEESIAKNHREMVRNKLESIGKKLIPISLKQVANFGGNMILLKNNKEEKKLILSQSAFDALLPAQRETLNSFCHLVPIAIPTIEKTGGGSVRCMISELFWPTRPNL